ncbi:formimidoyltransferase-cyclodeaminase-like [Fundulus heteroclitus]|uniref:formimidoyltransferase-cyclodeaminase-like n=1 Tax=Fundulus heteroclitus TaxID=8078 RepID=UPI00165A86A0|nr:formimidoyltransferase-cyclodeaminase-like [Fundulus heteroclitus]
MILSGLQAALKMPRNTAEEVKRREAAMQEGLQQAVAVPLALAEKISILWPPLGQMVQYGNIGCKSDAQVAAKALETAVFGAYYNVLINLKDVSDEAFKLATQRRVCELLQEARDNVTSILDAADKRT